MLIPYIKMTDLDTNKACPMFANARVSDMPSIVRTMNKINEEAARLTGKAVKYAFTIAFKVKN